MYKLNVYASRPHEKNVLHKFKVNNPYEVKYYLLSLIRQKWKIENYFFDGVLLSLDHAFQKCLKETHAFNDKEKSVQDCSNGSEWHNSFYRRYMNCISIIDELRGFCEIKPKLK